jgi:hypothetical protein
VHAARCNPLEKQQHLITVSSGLRRVQHACEPCPGRPRPLFASPSQLSIKPRCWLQRSHCWNSSPLESPEPLRLPFPPSCSGTVQCSTCSCTAPAPALHQADPLSTHASRPRAETYAAPFRPPTTGALHSALHVLRLSPSCPLICSRDASPCRKPAASSRSVLPGPPLLLFLSLPTPTVHVLRSPRTPIATSSARCLHSPQALLISNSGAALTTPHHTTAPRPPPPPAPAEPLAATP